MRFEEKLKANAHSEWLAHYVDYVGLKDMLHPVDKHHASLWTATTAATAFSVTTSNFVEMSAMRPSASEGAAGSKRGTAALDPKLMAALIGGTVVAMYGKDDMCEAARSARFRVALVAEVVKVTARGMGGGGCAQGPQELCFSCSLSCVHHPSPALCLWAGEEITRDHPTSHPPCRLCAH